MSASITNLTTESFKTTVTTSATPVLVDFWAPWCGPCRMLAPVVEEIAKEYTGKVKVCKLNTDEQPNAATRFKISAIPTLLLFKSGQVVEQIVGVHSKSEIKKHLDTLLSQ